MAKEGKAADGPRVLNMVLRKEFALEIVRGEKVREYRWLCDHWAKRLCTFDDPNDKFHITGLKGYDCVHFYPYNNKWHVDCEVERIQLVTVDEELQERYKYEMTAEVGDWLFIIHLGKVLDTNLEV